eukprot:gene5025-10064_t
MPSHLTLIQVLIRLILREVQVNINNDCEYCMLNNESIKQRSATLGGGILAYMLRQLIDLDL